MRNFIISMAMVSGVVVIVTTFNNGVGNSVVQGGTSVRSTVNENSIVINTDTTDNTTDIAKQIPIYNRVYQLTESQLQQKFSDRELIQFRDAKGQITALEKSNMNTLAAGVYIIRKDNRIFRFVKN